MRSKRSASEPNLARLALTPLARLALASSSTTDLSRRTTDDSHVVSPPVDTGGAFGAGRAALCDVCDVCKEGEVAALAHLRTAHRLRQSPVSKPPPPQRNLCDRPGRQLGSNARLADVAVRTTCAKTRRLTPLQLSVIVLAVRLRARDHPSGPPSESAAGSAQQREPTSAAIDRLRRLVGLSRSKQRHFFLTARRAGRGQCLRARSRHPRARHSFLPSVALSQARNTLL